MGARRSREPSFSLSPEAGEREEEVAQIHANPLS